MRYKCLILDHDDTAVDSTGYIHYPSFVAALKELRPGQPVLSLNDFVDYCFKPGFAELCRDIIKFNSDEQKRQQEIWHTYNEQKRADFFEGFPEFVQKFKQKGGIVTVVSHSESQKIEQDYLQSCGFKPDIIFGWELGPDKVKPHTYPVRKILEQFDLKPTEALILDDLRPALEMAHKCDVPFGAAGWSPKTPTIQKWMKSHADFYFDEVDSLARHVFE